MQLPIESRISAYSAPNQLSVRWPQEGLKLAVKNTFYTVESDEEEDTRSGSKSCVARMASGSMSNCCPEDDSSRSSSKDSSGTAPSISMRRSLSPLGVRLSVKNTFWSVESDDEDETWVGTKSCFARMSTGATGIWFDEDDDGCGETSIGLASTSLASTGLTSVGLASHGVASSEAGDCTPDAGHCGVDVGFEVPVVNVIAPQSQEAEASEPAAQSAGQRLPEPSLGSAGHGTVDKDGEPGCSPCAWFWRPNSCVFKGECKFCHLCPENEVKKRKKEKVTRLRQLDREEKERALQAQDAQ